MPPHIYVTVLDDLQNTAQMFKELLKRKSFTFLFSLYYCYRHHVVETLHFQIWQGK